MVRSEFWESSHPNQPSQGAASVAEAELKCGVAVGWGLTNHKIVDKAAKPVTTERILHRENKGRINAER